MSCDQAAVEAKDRGSAGSAEVSMLSAVDGVTRLAIRCGTVAAVPRASGGMTMRMTAPRTERHEGRGSRILRRPPNRALRRCFFGGGK